MSFRWHPVSRATDSRRPRDVRCPCHQPSATASTLVDVARGSRWKGRSYPEAGNGAMERACAYSGCGASSRKGRILVAWSEPLRGLRGGARTAAGAGPL